MPIQKREGGDHLAKKEASAEPSTKQSVEAFHFCVFAPPGSRRDQQSVMIIPLTMNDAGYRRSH